MSPEDEGLEAFRRASFGIVVEDVRCLHREVVRDPWDGVIICRACQKRWSAVADMNREVKDTLAALRRDGW